MKKVNLNEIAALELVLNYVSVKDSLTAAMNGFSEKEDIKSKENVDLCFKALDSFL